MSLFSVTFFTGLFVLTLWLIRLNLGIGVKLTLGRCKCNVYLGGKTALVTGGNSGLGYQTALVLAGRGCRVILADVNNCDQAKEEIIKQTGNANIVTKQFDLASLSSVRQLAEDVNETEERQVHNCCGKQFPVVGGLISAQVDLRIVIIVNNYYINKLYINELKFFFNLLTSLCTTIRTYEVQVTNTIKNSCCKCDKKEAIFEIRKRNMSVIIVMMVILAPIVIVAVKSYLKMYRRRCKSPICLLDGKTILEHEKSFEGNPEFCNCRGPVEKMNEKTVIVTGANNGIGKETAKELARRGAKVIMACRNLETGERARDDIIKTTGNPKVILKKIDLSSFKSIREFARDINSTEENLHVLVHNAGVWLSENLTSEDGLELTMATNHFGPFLLTHLLINLLKKSAPSRIVVVSSVSHHLAMVNSETLGSNMSLLPSWNYFNSKFANVSFTRELSRRLQNSGVTVNTLHPGMIKTEIWYGLPRPFVWLVRLIEKVFFKSSAEGCQTIVYLATSTEVANTSGKYFVDCKKGYMAKKAADLETNRKIWDLSEKIVQLTESERSI